MMPAFCQAICGSVEPNFEREKQQKMVRSQVQGVDTDQIHVIQSQRRDADRSCLFQEVSAVILPADPNFEYGRFHFFFHKYIDSHDGQELEISGSDGLAGRSG